MFTLKNTAPNYYETLMNSAFSLVKNDIAAVKSKAKSYEAIGKRKLAQVEYDKVNTYFYVIYYFVLIKMYIFSRAKKGLTTSYADINDKYELDKIKITVGCSSVNVDALLKLFNLTEGSTIGLGIGKIRVATVPHPITITQGSDILITNVPITTIKGSILIDEFGDIIVTNNNDYLGI